MTLAYPQRQKQLESFLHKLGLPNPVGIQWSLLDLALTHPTFSATANYDQLEFVGDAVVRLVAAEFLLEQYSSLGVGEFTAIRSILVSDRTLARLAESYGFDRYLLVAESARRDSSGRESRLAESFEAVLGALYLSTHSLKQIRPWLDPQFRTLVTEIRSDPARQNYKAALQEWSQAHYKALPEYRVLQSDQEGDDRFQAEVWFQDKRLGHGHGRSIKAAEQAAAQEAFWIIRGEQDSATPEGE